MYRKKLHSVSKVVYGVVINQQKLHKYVFKIISMKHVLNYSLMPYNDRSQYAAHAVSYFDYFLLTVGSADSLLGAFFPDV